MTSAPARDVLERVLGFQDRVFPDQGELYARLAKGQSPKVMVISCADSRVVPEQILQAVPGELFVCRNAGNIVPPSADEGGGVAASVEFGVRKVGVTDIVVCGHSDCGAMKGLMAEAAPADLPSVVGWLRHASAARSVVEATHAGAGADDRTRAAALANVSLQLQHLRTYPAVAAGLASGTLALHGWFFDIGHGQVLALDGATGEFRALTASDGLPVAVPARPPARAAGLEVAA